MVENTQEPKKLQSPTAKIAATRFLDFLDPMADEFHFQVFDDKKPPDRTKAETIVGTLADSWGKLVRANKAGCGVFVTVNSVVGPRRVATAVDEVRYHFVEIDGAKTLAEILALPFKPAWINESSPGKFHVYFRVTYDVVRDLAGFRSRQKQLAILYEAGRESHDLVRVMRLPGFYHKKDPANPFRVTNVYTDNDAPRYSIADFEAVLGKLARPTETTAERDEEPAAPETPGAVAAVIEFFKTEATPAISNTPTGKAGKQGNSTTYDVMCRARDMGVEQSTCLDLAWEHYSPRCDPPLDFDWLLTIVNNAYAYAQNTQGADSAEADFDGDPLDPDDPLPPPKDKKAKKAREEAQKDAADRAAQGPFSAVLSKYVLCSKPVAFIARGSTELMSKETFKTQYNPMTARMNIATRYKDDAAKYVISLPYGRIERVDGTCYRPGDERSIVDGKANMWAKPPIMMLDPLDEEPKILLERAVSIFFYKTTTKQQFRRVELTNAAVSTCLTPIS